MVKIGLDKLLFKKKKIRNKCGNLKNGAASKNRTCDPVITNDVLYHWAMAALTESEHTHS